MKPAQAVALGIALGLIAWGSLFITVLSQSHRTNQLLKDDQVLLKQDTTILNTEKNTQADLEHKIADLQDHVDCLFNLATQPNHSSAYIVNAGQCTISVAPARPAASAVASAPSSSPVSAPSSPQSAPDGGDKQARKAPAPAKSTVCKLTLGLLGC